MGVQAWKRMQGSLFVNKAHMVMVVAHGDDFICAGGDKGLDWFKAKLGGEFPIKCRGRLGPGPKDDKVVKVLNRAVEWRSEGIAVEADQRHVEIAAQLMGVKGNNNITAPGVKPRGEDEEFGGEALPRDKARVYRAVAARLNFVAMDRADMQFATKEACRDMSGPNWNAWRRLRRLVCYLVESPRLVCPMQRQRLPKR